MTTCYIIDDNENSIVALSSLISIIKGIKLVGTCKDPYQALDYIINHDEPPQLTFIHVDMPGLSGFEIAENINSLTTIIFTTETKSHAFDAFERHAFDFLLKPLDHKRLLQSISRYKRIFNKKGNPLHPFSERKFFYIKSDGKGKLTRINIDDINYIEAALNYVIIHQDESRHITYITMNDVQQHLPVESFTRIHKSYIINNFKIKAIEKNSIMMQDKTILVLGHAYKESFVEIIRKDLVFTRKKNIRT
jgi:DNA-binding LytR/AlgR family response regulator